MQHSSLYYKDIYLGTLYENGRFDYIVNSNQSNEMDMERIIHILEVIRESGQSDTFDFDRYVSDWNNFMFQDCFEFK